MNLVFFIHINLLSARSPIFTHLASSLVGLTTVRAHKSEVIFQRVFDQAQDVNSSAYYMYLASSRWFGFCLDWIGVSFVMWITFSCIYFRDCNFFLEHICNLLYLYLTSPCANSYSMFSDISASGTGLVIYSAILLVVKFQWGIYRSAEAENQMTSVERVIEYSQLESEAPLKSNEGNTN